MAKNKVITVQGIDIKFYKEKAEDFISLTDIAKKFNNRSDQLILNWIRTRNTVDFLGAWETLYNNNFIQSGFENIRNQAGSATFVLTVSDWVGQTNAIGIRAKAGRYGGTYAHKDIAFEFLSHLSPTFKLYVFKEFQRLKSEEIKEQKEALEWNLKRTLAKLNYTVHTDAIKEILIPKKVGKILGIIYATEADILNVAVFNMTAKEWRLENPKLKGNLRDYATHLQLLVLSNLEAVNAELIRRGLSEDERLEILNNEAIHQMKSLISSPSLMQLPDGEKGL